MAVPVPGKKGETFKYVPNITIVAGQPNIMLFRVALLFI
jgi:hypothetical protein